MTRKSRRPRLDDDGLPFLPMWLAKWENRTAHLTIEEDGCYWRLIRLTWKTPTCSLPVDRAWLRRHMRVDDATFDRLVAPILAEFFTSDGGRWRNPKLSEVWAAQTDAHERRKDAGKRGGSATALKNKETGRNKRGSIEVASQSHSQSHNHTASKLAGGGLQNDLKSRVREALGPAVSDPDDCGLDFAVDHWLEEGVPDEIIVDTVRRCTAAKREKPIRKLRALNDEVMAAHNSAADGAEFPQLQNAPAPPIEYPDGPAGAALRAVVAAKGAAWAQAWLVPCGWNGAEVYAPNEYARARIENEAGGILRANGYERVVVCPESS